MTQHSFMPQGWKELYDSEYAQENAIEARAYQIDAALDCGRLLLEQKNCSLELPTGTGKTLIACLLVDYWLSTNPKRTAIVIVPNRTLVNQHREVFQWLAPRWPTFSIPDSAASKGGWIRAIAQRARIVISTPLILANAVSLRSYPKVLAEQIGLVVVDEFDAFLTLEVSREDTARYHKGFDLLVTQLANDCRYMVTSATLPRGAMRFGRARTVSKFVADRLALTAVSIDEKTYAPQVPILVFNEIVCHSASMETLVQSLINSIGFCVRRVDQALGAEIHYDDVIKFADPVSKGFMKVVPVRDEHGKLLNRIGVSKPVKEAFSILAIMLRKKELLLEEATVGHYVEQRSREVRTKEGVFFLKEGSFLFWESNELAKRLNEPLHEHAPGQKTNAMLEVIDRFPDRRGVVFSRYLTVARSLRGLCEAHCSRQTFELNGEMSDAQRRDQLRQFRGHRNAVLFITRDTGGRGLDLPQADFSIFFSPKSRSDIVWQEVSRIRSRVGSPKPTFFLTFNIHFERLRLAKSIYEIQAVGRRVDCVSSPILVQDAAKIDELLTEVEP